MVPSPKYEIGQLVFFAGVVDLNETFPCKSCAGTGQWQATSAEGEIGHCDCPACSGRGCKALYSYGPIVYPRTIGSVRIDTCDTESPVNYMCRETGVGSGTIYRESRLFLTEAEAQRASEGEALAARLRLDEQNPDRARQRALWLKSHTDQRIGEANLRAIKLNVKLETIEDRLRDMYDTADMHFNDATAAKIVIQKIAAHLEIDVDA